MAGREGKRKRKKLELYPGVSSECLLESYALGNEQALRGLWHRHEEDVRRFVCYWLAPQRLWIRQRRFEDVCTEVWGEVAKSAKSFNRRSTFWTWVCKIAIRACSRHTKELLTRKEKQARKDADGKVRIREEEPDKSPPIPDEVERREFARDFEAALEDLPPDERRAFVLREKMELGLAEITEIMAVPRSTLQDLIARAAERLRFTLRRHAPERMRGVS